MDTATVMEVTSGSIAKGIHFITATTTEPGDGMAAATGETEDMAGTPDGVPRAGTGADGKITNLIACIASPGSKEKLSKRQ